MIKMLTRHGSSDLVYTIKCTLLEKYMYMRTINKLHVTVAQRLKRLTVETGIRGSSPP